MIGLATELRLALGFLTRVPVGPLQVDDRLLGRSLAWFPLVGLALGALLAAFAWFCGDLFPPPTVAALLVVLPIVATGALHLDGVADMCDGCYGGRDIASRLRIMKDSRVGAMGAVAIGCVLLLKFAALLAMPPQRLGAALLIAPAGGRWLQTVLAAATPYARPEGGTGGGFVTHAGLREAAIATVIVAAAAIPLLGLVGAVLLLVLVLIALGWRAYSMERLGGVTGDVLGAACEWGEAVILLLLTCTLFDIA